MIDYASITLEKSWQKREEPTESTTETIITGILALIALSEFALIVKLI